MEITISNRIIINNNVYSLSIAVTSFLRSDGITAQLLHCFRSCLSKFIDRFYFITFGSVCKLN